MIHNEYMRQYFQSLQSRLVLLIVIVALPGLIGLIYHSFLLREHAIDNAIKQAINTVDATTAEQSNLIRRTETFLQRLSTFNAVLDPNSIECSTFLSNVLKINDNYINIGVPRADGELLCNAKPLNKRVNVADRPYIQKALTTHSVSISEFQIDRATGVTSINFAYPVIHPHNNETIGLAVAVISLEWWSKRLYESDLPENTVAYITDHEQKIIATYPTNNALLGTKMELTKNHQQINNNTLSPMSIFKSSDNHMRMFVSHPLLTTSELSDISISVGIPLDKELSMINQRLMESGILLFIFIVAMFLIAAWGVNKSVLIPLKTLLRLTKNLELGIEIGNIPQHGSTELIDLQKNFTLMAKARLNNEKQLTLAASVFSHAREGIIIADAEGSIIDINNSFVEITGYTKQDVLGKTLNSLRSDQQSPVFYRQLLETLFNKGYWNGEIWNKRKNGEAYAQLLTISAVNDNNKIRNYVAVFTDISESKKQQLQLEHMAHYDVLTNLPNRSLLADRLHKALARSKKNKRPLAVAFLDLDGFKEINDTYGHSLGDELLVILSDRLKNTLGDNDTLSRFGGDEFVAVLANLEHPLDFKTTVAKMLNTASKPILLGGNLLNVSVSIGIAPYPADDTNTDQLIRHADQAMYTAKQKGKNCYHIFDIESEGSIKIHNEQLQIIKQALEQHEFILYYQPKVNMRTGDIIGVEALIRWQHPEKGLLPPAEFLPVIENHHLIIDIGEWVIEESLNQIAQWQKQSLHLPISININALQLQQKDFDERLTLLLNNHSDVAPNTLQLEVLETSALSNIEDVSDIMNRCVNLGVNFAIDDFGTGYSSLTYLKQLPAELIKIDQTFIRDMLLDPEDRAIVTGVLALATSFNRKVIAEGVETIDHGTALLQLGCELAQGYGIAKPMPAHQIPEWANHWKPDKKWH